MTFWQYCDNFPPILVRLLARQSYGPPLTTAEIVKRAAERSRLTLIKVEIISELCDWSTVPFGDMRAFLHGCNSDFCDSKAKRRADSYLRKNPSFAYLEKSPLFKTYYQPLLKSWHDHYFALWIDTNTGSNKGTKLHPPLEKLWQRIHELLKKWDNWDKPLSEQMPKITPARDII